MALLHTEVKVEIIEISLKNRPKELYKASKKGTVPVLITVDGLVIDESLEIMLWALKNNSEQSWWLPAYHDKAMDIIDYNDNLFKKWLDRYKYHVRFPENTKEFYRGKCSEILWNYEKSLNKTKYLLSNHLTIVDIAIFPFIRQFANVDYVWFEHTYNKLPDWLNEICTSDLFVKVIKKI